MNLPRMTFLRAYKNGLRVKGLTAPILGEPMKPLVLPHGIPEMLQRYSISMNRYQKIALHPSRYILFFLNRDNATRLTCHNGGI